MGSSDRDYFREDRRPAGAGMPAVTKGLLIAIVAIFVIDFISGGETRRPLRDWGAFTVASCFQEGRLWELLTFQFLHGSVGHILFNAFALGIFGPPMERWWGGRRFLLYYLLSGAGGALFFSLLVLLGLLPNTGVGNPLVGASAGIYGCLIGVARLMPDLRMQLLFVPVALTMRQVAYGVIGLAVLMIAGDLLLGWSIFWNAGGEAGHLGGALVGFLLLQWPALLGKRDGRVASSGAKIVRPKEFRRPRGEAKLRPRSPHAALQDSEVDRILDKIHREGLASLTEEERQLLQEASKEHER